MAWTAKRGKTWTGYYRDPSRRKRSKGGFLRKRDAYDWAISQEQSVSLGTHVAPRAGRVTFGTWAERWLATLNVSPRTRDGYTERLRSLVLPRWKDVPLDRIGLSDVKAWCANMPTLSGGTASAMRRRDAAQLFARMLDAAVDEGLLPRNPVHTRSGRKADYLPKAHVKKEHRYLTHEHVRRLADAASPEARRLILVTAYTGLRFGEVTALRARDVNPLGGHISVGRAFTRLDNGQIILGGTKTGRSRTVVVPPSMRQLLTASVEGKRPDDLVFPAENGQPLRRDNFTQREFARAVEAASTAVTTLQTALGTSEHLRTGVMSLSTTDKLRTFQLNHGLASTGETDEATWLALSESNDALGTHSAGLLRRLSHVRLVEGSEDFPRLTFHDLRHTAASLAVAAGADIKALQSMLGHASASMTLDVYAGLFPGSLEAVADRLDGQLTAMDAHILPTPDVIVAMPMRTDSSA
ncbi:tyrosine-type recombinase/integrase [Cellulomonas sp. P5_E12]